MDHFLFAALTNGMVAACYPRLHLAFAMCTYPFIFPGSRRASKMSVM